MNLSVNKNLNFKGAVITPYYEQIMTEDVKRDNNIENIKTIPLDFIYNNPVLRGNNAGYHDELILTNSDCTTFDQCLENNKNKIPVEPQFSNIKGRFDVNEDDIKASKLAYAIAQVNEKTNTITKLPQGSNVDKFIADLKTMKDSENPLRKTVLTEEILRKALEYINSRENKA